MVNAKKCMCVFVYLNTVSARSIFIFTQYWITIDFNNKDLKIIVIIRYYQNYNCYNILVLMCSTNVLY